MHSAVLEYHCTELEYFLQGLKCFLQCWNDLAEMECFQEGWNAFDRVGIHLHRVGMRSRRLECFLEG
jgi:hypothetical protein